MKNVLPSFWRQCNVEAIGQCCPTRGPHAARKGIPCGPPSSHINCSFGPVISQIKSTCKIQQCLMVFCVSKFQKNGRICGFHWTFGSKKCFSFCPWTPLEAPTPDPPYRLALRALAMAPLDCSPPAGGKLTKWPAVSKRLDSTAIGTLWMNEARKACCVRSMLSFCMPFHGTPVCYFDKIHLYSWCI